MWNTYFWVDSADETAARAAAAGATIITEPFDVFDAGRMAMFADTEGAPIAVWEPNRPRRADPTAPPSWSEFSRPRARVL